jgi:hypothetical protein
MNTTNNSDRDAVQKLMEEAEMMAHYSIRQTGAVSPTLLIHGVDGKVVLAPQSMENEAIKDHFVLKARLACLAHGADATVFLSEAWMRMPSKTGQSLDLSIPPSEAPDRVEAVIIMGETRNGHYQKVLPMLRSEQGKFIGFGEMPEIIREADQVKGRFAQFVPPDVPTEEVRKEAKAALAILGMVPADEKKRERGQGRAIF